MAGEPGFEPGLTESESVGLPLTYSPTGLERQGAGEAVKCADALSASIRRHLYHIRRIDQARTWLQNGPDLAFYPIGDIGSGHGVRRCRWAQSGAECSNLFTPP